MNNAIQPEFSVSEAVAVFNQIFETATPIITVVGEVANFKISQGKWAFFDLKDTESSVGCFMSVFNLRIGLENGMRVMVSARPQITKWGKFSLTIQAIKPVGEGAIQRAFEILRAKLDSEGLFASERKRRLSAIPEHIGVISSTGAAGYADFIKILDERFGGLKIDVANVQVQGEAAPRQIMAALKYFNESLNPPEVIAILRGGGSRDDLIAFDDEALVRAIASSRIPIITGIGHEIDTTLADLAADVRAATPSNAAQILVPDKREIVADLDGRLKRLILQSSSAISSAEKYVNDDILTMTRELDQIVSDLEMRSKYLNKTLRQLNPRTILNRGYAILRYENGKIVRDRAEKGEILTVETNKIIIETEVKNVHNK
ncbi:MAG: exodeoxyribonuclease VII large subunit [Candidatus Nomurabacteria bacterium]|nr:exodeoxyribonuclease VII large subunit [Candidatus Nomurabacteria bacterium]